MFRLLCRVLLFGVLLLPLWGTTGPGLAGGKGVVKKSSVPWKVYQFRTLIRGPLVGSNQIIRDGDSWKKIVGEHPELGKLNVDFSKQMILVYAEKPQGRGKHLFHVEVKDECDKLHAVFYFRLALPGGPHFQDIIFPNHFVVVDRSDKPVQFTDDFHSELERLPFELFFVPAQNPPLESPKNQGKLSISVEGNELVVSTTIIANNSPHVLHTSYYVGGNGNVHLKYILVQNKDLLVRSQKKIKVTWRLNNLAIPPVQAQLSYHVEPTNLILSTDELGVLIPQLQGLKQSGEPLKPHPANPQ